MTLYIQNQHIIISEHAPFLIIPPKIQKLWETFSVVTDRRLHCLQERPPESL
jgi:hypothetical protein